MNLKDKTVFITGGSSGLGLSLVKAFIEKRSKVITNGTSEESLSDLKAINSDKLFTQAFDIRDVGHLEKIISQYSPIDIFINNAGIWLEGNVGEISSDDISKIIDVNLTGVINACNLVVPTMKKAGRGYIVNIASTSGLKARGGQAIYVASKFGVRGFTDSIRDELSESGINVIGLYPGGMNTPFYTKRKSSVDATEWMNTDEIASNIIGVLEKDESLTTDHIVFNRKKKGGVAWK